MTFTCREVSEVWVIALEGEVDPGTVIALQRKINRALDSGSGGVVIDLGAVSGVGAQTLSLFCGALRRRTRDWRRGSPRAARARAVRDRSARAVSDDWRRAGRRR